MTSLICDKYLFEPPEPGSFTLQGVLKLTFQRTVLSLYMRVFRIARTWQAQSGVACDTLTERNYILQEARTLFRQNQQMTDQESIKKCIEECEARIEIGLHYRIPYPRATYLPPMGLATQKGRKLRVQQRLRKQAKPIYLESHEET
ncbi:LYR motif containing protein 1 isoform X2 [Vanacampus margaritifer]